MTSIPECNGATTAASASSTSVISAGSEKLSKAEKKALYREQYPEPLGTRREELKKMFSDGSVDKEAKEAAIWEAVARYADEECRSTPLDDPNSTPKVQCRANPFHAVLDLHVKSSDYTSQKTDTLAAAILAAFSAWLDAMGEEERKRVEQHWLTQHIRKSALRAVTGNKSTLHLSAVDEAFGLAAIREEIVNEIEMLCRDHKFASAIHLATQFSVYEEFDIDSFVIPCLLCDKVPLIEDYLTKAPGHRLKRDYLLFMDSLVGLEKSEVRNALSSYTERDIMKEKEINRFQGKTLEKFINKSVEVLGMCAERDSPNMYNSRQFKHLEFLLKEGAFKPVDECYFDKVEEHLASNRGQVEWVVRHLSERRREREAVIWALHFQLDRRKWPSYVRGWSEQRVAEVQQQLDALTAANASNVELDVGGGRRIPIEMVETAEQLKALEEVLKGETIIGLDTEWSAMVTYNEKKDKVSLLQVAVPSRAFLVDFLSIEKCVSLDDRHSFMQTLFCGHQLKCGFDFRNDVKVLEGAVEGWPIQERMRNVVCLAKLTNALCDAKPDIIEPLDPCTGLAWGFDASSGQRHFKLTDLVASLTGKPLDKQYQMSHWEKRPLRAGQLRYAAMDAWCQIACVDRLHERADAASLDWEQMLAASRLGEEEVKKEKIKKKKGGRNIDDDSLRQLMQEREREVLSRLAGGDSGDGEMRRPMQVRVIVDEMLSGFGKCLRRIGVDTIICGSRQQVAETARDLPDRIILSTGKAYRELSQRFPRRALDICVQDSPVDALKRFLRDTRCVVKQCDIFSRCMKCNSDCLIVAPSVVMLAMWDATVDRYNEFARDDYQGYSFISWCERIRGARPEDHDGWPCRLMEDEGVLGEERDGDEPVAAAECSYGVVMWTCGYARAHDLYIPIKVQLTKVPYDVLCRYKFFYVCGECGQVYWDGSHLRSYAEHMGRKEIV